MDLLKTLKSTTIISGTALLAFAATDAHAQDTSALGHMSASLTSTLSIVEASPMKFGNFTLNALCMGAGCDAGDATLVLDPKGGRTEVNGGTTDEFTLLVGTNAGGTDAAGIADAVSGLGTGGQAPGFFTISGVEGGVTDVYVSFANSSGALIDAAHPNNYATVAGPGAVTFRVKNFTFESDDGTATGPSSSGYTQAAASVADAYGRKVACASPGPCTIRVGATLQTVDAAIYAPGAYQGTYYVMVSY